jgi:hypothetical protein
MLTMKEVVHVASIGCDMSRVTFVSQSDSGRQILGSQQSTQEYAQNNTMPNYKVFCNICTVNYLLADIYKTLSSLRDALYAR